MDTQQTPPAQAPAAGVLEVGDETFVAEVMEAGLPVLVDFKAEWCGPCKRMAPIFARLAAEYDGRVKFVKLDVDESPEVASALGIQAMPTFALFDGNTVVAAGVGALPEPDLRRWIDTNLPHADSPAPEATA